MYHVRVGHGEKEVRAKEGDVGSDTVEILTHTHTHTCWSVSWQCCPVATRSTRQEDLSIAEE